MGTFIDLKSADGVVIPAYVAQTAGKPKGGVVVLQEIFGVNSHIRQVADGYAADGYLAVAPATFHRVKAGVELGYTPDDIAAGFALKTAAEALGVSTLMQDVQAAVDYAASAGKVGVVGYCWGGLMAWRAACLLNGVSASAPYYGGGTTTEAEIARKPKCPVLAHYGALDQHISLESVEAFKRAHPEVQTEIYDANHGFNCDHRASYGEAAAKLARQRTIAFFTQHVG
jgi:carboxymethylenebutenolidase